MNFIVLLCKVYLAGWANHKPRPLAAQEIMAALGDMIGFSRSSV
jgi:hypothetical protein